MDRVGWGNLPDTKIFGTAMLCKVEKSIIRVSVVQVFVRKLSIFSSLLLYTPAARRLAVMSSAIVIRMHTAHDVLSGC